MRAELAIWISVVMMATGGTAAMVYGMLPWAAALFAAAGLAVAYRLGRSLATDVDARWLPLLLPLAYAAKLFGAVVHHYFVTVVYQTGDSLGYHRIGLEVAEQWRAGQIPVVTGRSAGTRFVELVTGLFYSPADPSMLIGYFVFTSLSFLGMVALYAAFRRIFPMSALRRYAILLFFLPSMLFWPSTIGKEALMLLFIGLASYGAARLFGGANLGALGLFGLGVVGMAAVRPHVAVLLVAAFVVALLLSRRVGSNLKPLVKAAIVALTLVAFWSLLSVAMARLGIEPGGENLDEFLVEQERHTAQGGSAVVGAPVRNPLDLPEATLRVLFRPLPNEAHNAQAVLSALEGTALLVLVAWRVPTMIRNSRLLLSRPYLLFSLAFVMEFVVAFSTIFNLGILARQRTQVLPFLLALLVGMGWNYAERKRTVEVPDVPAPRVPIPG